eukprot:g16064.t1
MWTLDEFELGQKLGEGAFGRVYLARRGRSIVALKILQKSKIARNRAQKFVEREIDIQSHLHHPCILALYAYFWDDSSIYLVLEHSHLGDLRKLVVGREMTPIPLGDIQQYVKHTVSGLRFLHDREIMYRDLKSENLLLFHPTIVKLSDFGAAVHAPRIHDAHRRRTLLGNPYFYAPEMITDKYYEYFTDLWALGLLLFELLFGVLPVEGIDAKITRKTTQIGGAAGEVEDHVVDQFVIYKRILTLDVKKQIAKCAEIAEAGNRGWEVQDWFKDEKQVSGEDLIQKLLVTEPARRLKCAECLKHAFIAAGGANASRTSSPVKSSLPNTGVV